ncbi:MAG TPA: thermonuclease family protein, partial [Crenalkalicoccus sp.]|nr:thermonuclease family protein [Crenalkalicoccus sp.]
RDLDCRLDGRDAQGRALGTCRAGGTEVNSGLVAAGWARAEGPDLAGAEAAARNAGRGLWGSAGGGL